MADLESTYIIYKILSKLTTPFNKTPAYKLGIINKDGDILRKRGTLTTSQERSAYTVFDGLIWKIRKLIQRLPWGKNKIANFAAAMWLIRESKNYDFLEKHDDILSECLLEEIDNYERNLGNKLEMSVIDEFLELVDSERDIIEVQKYPKKRKLVVKDNIIESLEKDLYPLFEGLSPILYHGTSLEKGLSILEGNKFRLSTAIGTSSESDINKNKFYYFSTARSPSSQYLNQGGTKVVFVLDGIALSHNYKGQAVDYWNQGKDVSITAVNKEKTDEMEDRIITDKPVIENAMRYIKEVYVSMVPDDSPSFQKEQERAKETIRKIMIICKNHSIPVHFKLPAKHYITPYKWMKLPDQSIDYLEPKLDRDRETYSPTSRRTVFKEFFELTYIHDEKKLSKKAIEILYNIKYYTDSVIRSLSADIHNRKTNTEQIKRLIEAFKSVNARSPKEFVEALKRKWHVAA